MPPAARPPRLHSALRVGALALLLAAPASAQVVATPMDRARAQDLSIRRAIDAWVRGDALVCDRWVHSALLRGEPTEEVLLRAQLLRAGVAVAQGDAARLQALFALGAVPGVRSNAFELPASERGQRALVPTLRDSMRQLGAGALDARDWRGAELRYGFSDSLRRGAAASLHWARTDAGADSLWRLWSGSNGGVLSDPSVRWRDARGWLREIAPLADVASDLRVPRDAVLARAEIAGNTLSWSDGATHPLASEAPAPTAIELDAALAVSDSLASVTRAWSEARADLEQLERSRARLARYLARGRAALAVERARRDSLALRVDVACGDAIAALRGLDSARASASNRLAERVARLRERAGLHALCGGAMTHFYVEGPDWPDPAPPPHAAPGAVISADRTLAGHLDRSLERAGTRASDWLREGFHERFGPEIDARRASMEAELAALESALDALSGRLDGLPAERSLADACALATERAQTLARAHDAVAARWVEEKRALAHGWADRAETLLRAEAEADLHGLASAAYGAAAESPTPEKLRLLARARLERLLAEFPESHARGEARYRLAEVLLAEERERMHRSRLPLDPTASLALYDAILEEDPTFPHRDAALHQAGLLRLDLGEPLGADHLASLLAEHPSSPFVQSAQIRLGTVRFEDARIEDAAGLFLRAADGPDPALGAIALYQLGWCRTNQDRLLEASDAFRRLLDRYEAGLVATARFDLRRESERDLVRCLARSGGASAFRTVLGPHGPRAYHEEVLVQLSELLREHALFVESAQTEALRIERAPLGAQALDASARRIEALELGFRSEEADSARLESAERFAPDGPWARAQESDSLRVTGSGFARDQLIYVATERHVAAREGAGVAPWREAAEMHERLIARWPGDRDVPRWEFLSGEARFRSDDFEGARAHFRSAADSDTARFALDAAWQEVAVSDAWYEATRAGGELGSEPQADRLLESSDRFRERAPDDPRVPDLLWRESQIALAHERTDRCLETLRALAARHPSDARAPEGMELAASLLARVGRRRESAQALFDLARGWPERAGADTALYRAALTFREEKAPEDALAALQRLTSAHPGSELSRDAWLVSAEIAAATREPRQAAQAYRAFAERFRADEDAPAALLRSADLYGEAGDSTEAVGMRLAYIEARPDDEPMAMSILEPLSRRELSRGEISRGEMSRGELARRVSDPSPDSHLSRYLELAARNPHLAAPDIVAQVEFVEAEALAATFANAPLAQPLAPSLERKRLLLESALAAYRGVAERGVPEWRHASLVRTGDLLVELGAALEASERPAELSGEDRAAYDQVLSDQAWELYEQGESIWSDLLRNTRGEEHDPGDWLARARETLWPRIAARFLHRPEVAFPVVLPLPPEETR